MQTAVSPWPVYLYNEANGKLGNTLNWLTFSHKMISVTEMWNFFKIMLGIEIFSYYCNKLWWGLEKWSRSSVRVYQVSQKLEGAPEAVQNEWVKMEHLSKIMVYKCLNIFNVKEYIYFLNTE